MRQQTLAVAGDGSFEKYRKPTRREVFLAEMDRIVPWAQLVAPSSTKNKAGQRDPEMHQTKKGNQWCVSRTRAQARDAVLKMGDGLPEPAYRSRLQTARCCCVQEAWW